MTTMDRAARVLIVDDHPVVRTGLKTLLADERDFEVCAEADGTSAALDALERTSPDVMVVDLSLADGSGLELIKEVAHRDSSIRILVASMHDETLFAERALRAGAHGYINKDEAPGHLVSALRRILSGSIALSQAMTDRILMSVAAGDLDHGVSELDQLSDRELEVFELLGQGLTTRAAAEHLNLSVKTIETYRENIKAKLDLDDANALVHAAVRWVAEQV